VLVAGEGFLTRSFVVIVADRANCFDIELEFNVPIAARKIQHPFEGEVLK
jgi:hypothetical protein